MANYLATVLLALMLLLALTACGGGTTEPPLPVEIPITMPSESPTAPATPTPTPGSADEASPETIGDVARGQLLYNGNCSRCHGQSAAGASKAGSLLGFSNEETFFANWQGDSHKSGGSFSSFPDTDRQAIWSWLRSLK
ncbi:c-type cytochrome [Chloroflexota bacterium]